MEEKFVNDIFKKTLIITSEDVFPPIYYPIKNRMEFNVKQFDYEKVKDVIDKFHNKLNIVVDGRLEYLILAIHINYPNYCLVYDINNSDTGKVIDSSVYLASRNIIDLKRITIYSQLGVKIIDLYMFVKYFCSNVMWKSTLAKDLCERNNCLVDILINYIGVKNFIINEDTKRYVKEIREVVKNNFTKRDKVFENVDVLFSALTMIKTTEDTLKNY